MIPYFLVNSFIKLFFIFFKLTTTPRIISSGSDHYPVNYFTGI